ncbi:23S rRNA (pseudouridine(1915)-N(3))-methyltransferase RlmH [Alphaproteobacteria bacterium]|nr:23S rRNA (pseudouridine(1915)-N(3))-methyltransferase RlmH [Alphaproteobacteria bacterium]
MLKIEIIAVGSLKSGSFYDLVQRYSGMIQYPLTIHELKDDHKIAEKLNPQAVIWAMDERGKSFGSTQFASDIQDLSDSGVKQLQFVIGGADGLSDEVRNAAQKLISFGKQTWPHMMARVMLLEQIYRAQQILKGHPYHRE